MHGSLGEPGREPNNQMGSLRVLVLLVCWFVGLLVCWLLVCWFMVRWFVLRHKNESFLFLFNFFGVSMSGRQSRVEKKKKERT